MEGFPNMRRELETAEFMYIISKILAEGAKKRTFFRKTFFTKTFKAQYQYLSKIRDTFYVETEEVKKERTRLKKQLMEHLKNISIAE